MENPSTYNFGIIFPPDLLGWTQNRTHYSDKGSVLNNFEEGKKKETIINSLNDRTVYSRLA